MTFPIHVLDDVTYCTRLEIHMNYTSLIRCQLFEAYNPWHTVSFLWLTVSFCNTLNYQILSVAISRRLSCLCLCKRPKWKLPALAWDACQGYQASRGRTTRTVRDWSWTPLFDPGKFCGPITEIWSSTSCLYGYNTVVHDFPKISGKLSACASSGYQALLSRAGRAWERG